MEPFIGSGTTAVAARLGRNYVGIDINEEYCQMTEERLLQKQLQLLEMPEAYKVGEMQ